MPFTGPNLEQSVSWRVSLVLAAFIMLTSIVEVTLFYTHKALADSPKTRGLLSALVLVKEEILNVGCV